MLIGWHPGKRTVRARLGLGKGPSAQAYTWIRDEMPEQHRIFYSHNLPFLPLMTVKLGAGRGHRLRYLRTTLESVASQRALTRRELVLRLSAPIGDPFIENLTRLNVKDSEATADVLIAGLGIELETRRRNKFAGRVVHVSKIKDRARHINLRVNQAIG